MSENELVDEAADELYGLPPGEFTRARDERAKKVRADGDREAANAVKALRKPTVAAWALNQLSRRRGKDLDALLAAGEKLRAAQEELVGGGDRSGFQKAASRERELVAKLAGDATTLASEAGESGAGLQEKIAGTLHAATLDESVAEELRAGRLTRDREAIGGFGAAGGGAAPTRSRSKPNQKPSPAPSSNKQDAERKQRLTVARTDERHARRELEAAERAVQHAEERADAAAAHAKEAEERARTTAERLKEAKRAQTAARKAHARARRELEKAENAAS